MDYNFYWESPSTQDLNTTISDALYWEQPIKVFGNVGTLSYKVISGRLPPGLELNEHKGIIQGIPVVTDLYQDIIDISPDVYGNISTDVSRPYKFTIRAKDNYSIEGNIIDKSFNLSVSNMAVPVIMPRPEPGDPTAYNLGTYPDGTIFKTSGSTTPNLSILESNPSTTITWSIIQGELPPELTLNSDGQLVGIIYPVPSYNKDQGKGWDGSRWSVYPWDFAGNTISKTFNFTVQAYDGENIDRVNYTMTVVPLKSLTVDSTIISIDCSTITSDAAADWHIPILLNTETVLPRARQQSYYAYKFNALDLDGDTIKFKFESVRHGLFDDGEFDSSPFDSGAGSPWPAGLIIDEDTGWLYGNLETQTDEILEYNFIIRVYKEKDSSYISEPKLFKLLVLGDFVNPLDWKTDTDIGPIENGSISELLLETVINDRNFGTPVDHVVYTLEKPYPYTNYPNRILMSFDQDHSERSCYLELHSNGLITGRVPFNHTYFFDGDNSLWEDVITFDNGDTTFDCRVEFTANASGYSDTDELITSIQRTFTLTVNNTNLRPYENLYIKALPNYEQRTIFQNIMSNSDIFSENLIYRSDDLNFGVTRHIKSLFLPGLTPQSAYAYAEAMQHNHYNKPILFGDIKTAVAKDANLNIKYEVVYIELLDDLINANSESPPLAQDLSNKISVGYLLGENEYKIAYLGSFRNMTTRIEDGIGYNKKGALPDWMTSRQLDGRVLGFTRALVLCYLVHSNGRNNAEIVAKRLRDYMQTENFTFNEIEFIVDRYILDLNLESYYDINDKYLKFPNSGVFV